MLFDALTDFYERNGGKMQTTAHRLVEIDWLLELDENGTFRGFSNQSEQDFEVVAPASMRSGNKKLAHLVVDNASYVLAHWKTASTGKKRHEKYCEKVEEAAERIDDDALHALDAFLKSEDEIEKALAAVEDEEIDYKDELLPVVSNGTDTFLACQDGQSPSGLHRALQREWRRMFEEEYEAYVGECLACGREKPTLRVHERVSIFGSSYTSVANMNEAAFESHGLEQSANAPMCADCVSGYVQPLRYFSDSDRHKWRIRYDGDAGEASGWLTWLRVDAPGYDRGFMSEPPDEGEALDALKSIYRSDARDLEDNQFYAVSLTVSDNRFSVRSFVRRTLGDVIEKTEDYFDRQRIVRNGEEQTYSLLSLIEAAAPLASDDNTRRREPDREKLPPRFVDALVEHILTGQSLPASLRDRALRRCRVEQAATAEDGENSYRIDGSVPVHRAALLKLFLSQTDGPMPTQELDREHPDPAYHCGRYLAAADSVYYHAKDQAENYISKRYYSSASTTPASVIGRIIPNVQHQLDTLRSSRGGLATNLDKIITQIMGRIGDFPKILKPTQQARFALGFYHQRDHLMTAPNEEDGNGDDSGNDNA